ncbi:MAG: hypothetical protein WDW38_000882 [Sanguina aurantia]
MASTTPQTAKPSVVNLFLRPALLAKPLLAKPVPPQKPISPISPLPPISLASSQASKPAWKMPPPKLLDLVKPTPPKVFDLVEPAVPNSTSGTSISSSSSSTILLTRPARSITVAPPTVLTASQPGSSSPEDVHAEGQGFDTPQAQLDVQEDMGVRPERPRTATSATDSASVATPLSEVEYPVSSMGGAIWPGSPTDELLKYRAAGVLPYRLNTSSGKLELLLMQQYSEHRRTRWTMLGGKIEERDGSPEATAAREAEEESHRALSHEEVLPLLSAGHAVWLKHCKYVLYLAHVPEDQTTDLPKICQDNIAGGRVHPAAEKCIQLRWFDLEQFQGINDGIDNKYDRPHRMLTEINDKRCKTLRLLTSLQEFLLSTSSAQGITNHQQDVTTSQADSASAEAAGDSSSSSGDEAQQADRASASTAVQFQGPHTLQEVGAASLAVSRLRLLHNDLHPSSSADDAGGNSSSAVPTTASVVHPLSAMPVPHESGRSNHSGGEQHPGNGAAVVFQRPEAVPSSSPRPSVLSRYTSKGSTSNMRTSSGSAGSSASGSDSDSDSKHTSDRQSAPATRPAHRGIPSLSAIAAAVHAVCAVSLQRQPKPVQNLTPAAPPPSPLPSISSQPRSVQSLPLRPPSPPPVSISSSQPRQVPLSLLPPPTSIISSQPRPAQALAPSPSSPPSLVVAAAAAAATPLAATRHLTIITKPARPLAALSPRQLAQKPLLPAASSQQVTRRPSRPPTPHQQQAKMSSPARPGTHMPHVARESPPASVPYPTWKPRRAAETDASWFITQRKRVNKINTAIEERRNRDPTDEAP